MQENSIDLEGEKGIFIVLLKQTNQPTPSMAPCDAFKVNGETDRFHAKTCKQHGHVQKPMSPISTTAYAQREEPMPKGVVQKPEGSLALCVITKG